MDLSRLDAALGKQSKSEIRMADIVMAQVNHH